ncbi:hypothetical protein HZP65_01300 [Elizabethkingia anophelis]|nr:hypothetical protein [Elizabethkingia anophelis]MCT4275601.1 hypothetical protein [Elizabethkingia anophelis]MCT4278387.1 hypothetical protein [Elizabethkingia anophelis]
MKNIFMLLGFASITIFAQTNFEKGYKAGYGEGYCYDKGIGCIKPLSPLPPIPKIDENTGSYQDGYNRGFQHGIDAQKSNVKSNSTDRQRYQTFQPKFDTDFIYQPNYELMQKVLEKKQENYERMKVQVDKLYTDFLLFLYNYNSTLPKNILDQYVINFIEYSESYIKRNNPKTYSHLKSLIDQLMNDFENGVELTEKREAINAERERNNLLNYQKSNSRTETESIKPFYSGVVEVYTNSELYDKPDMIEGNVIYSVQNGKVKILERVKDGKYYKVDSNGHIGFISLISIKSKNKN